MPPEFMSILIGPLLVLGPLPHATRAQESEGAGEALASETAEAVSEAEGSEEEAAGVEERGIANDIAKCVGKATKFPPDPNGAKRCLESLVSSKVAAAERPLNTTISNLRRDVTRTNDGVTAAVNNATAVATEAPA